VRTLHPRSGSFSRSCVVRSVWRGAARSV
jgi:hypothetical protein